MSHPLPQSSCSSPRVSRMGVSSHPPTRRWDLSNPQITHVSHFSKSLKVNRAHKNKPDPAIHPPNLAKPCDVLRTHVFAAGQTSGGKKLEQTNGDIERKEYILHLRLIRTARKTGMCNPPASRSSLRCHHLRISPTFTKPPKATPVLPGEFHGQRSLAGYRPCSHK